MYNRYKDHLKKRYATLKKIPIIIFFEEHFVACGGRNESVLLWDVRSPAKVLYEISTGNCVVNDIGYHEKSRTLLPLVECMYVDRLGGRYYGNHGDRDDYDSEIAWPANAKHTQMFFPETWDMGW